MKKQLGIILFFFTAIYINCENKVDEFVRLALLNYETQEVGSEKLIELYEQLSEEEQKKARKEVAQQIWADAIFYKILYPPNRLSPYPITDSFEKKEDLDWYDSFESFETTSCEEIPARVYVEPSLGFKKGESLEEVASKKEEIKVLIQNYFMTKTIEELQDEDSLKKEIIKLINGNVLSRSKVKKIALLRLDILRME